MCSNRKLHIPPVLKQCSQVSFQDFILSLFSFIYNVRKQWTCSLISFKYIEDTLFRWSLWHNPFSSHLFWNIIQECATKTDTYSSQVSQLPPPSPPFCLWNLRLLVLWDKNLSSFILESMMHSDGSLEMTNVVWSKSQKSKTWGWFTQYIFYSQEPFKPPLNMHMLEKA